jgi:tRNA(Ile)-lysidine synthase TilS/MesJ
MNANHDQFSVLSNEYCEKMENQLFQYFVELNLKQNSNFLLSVSGGSDSIAMLHLFKSLKAKYLPDLNIELVHFNHKFRFESEEEVRFLQKSSYNVII